MRRMQNHQDQKGAPTMSTDNRVFDLKMNKKMKFPEIAKLVGRPAPYCFAAYYRVLNERMNMLAREFHQDKVDEYAAEYR